MDHRFQSELTTDRFLLGDRLNGELLQNFPPAWEKHQATAWTKQPKQVALFN